MPIDPDVLLRSLTSLPLTLRLYADTPGGDRAEAVGYEPHIFGPSEWTIRNGIAWAEWSFRFATAAGAVGGYYLTTPQGDALSWEPLTGGPVTVEVAGSELKVICELQAIQ